MYTWSTAQIRALALQNKGSRSRLSFIRSEPVAHEVAARVLQRLTAAGMSESRAREVTQVGACPMFQGTWMVSVSLPGMQSPRAPGRVYTQAQLHALAAKRRARLQTGLEALRDAHSAADLVTTWTGKHPPMAP